MSFPARRILVDTNVWVDNYVSTRPSSPDAQAFFDSAFAAGAELLYPVHVLKDVYYLIGAYLKRQARSLDTGLTEQKTRAIAELAWAAAKNMHENATAVGADESDAWKAFGYRTLTNDLEDSFVLEAAERARADMLVTSDVRLIAKATVPAHTPGDACIFLRG